MKEPELVVMRACREVEKPGVLSRQVHTQWPCIFSRPAEVHTPIITRTNLRWLAQQRARFIASVACVSTNANTARYTWHAQLYKILVAIGMLATQHHHTAARTQSDVNLETPRSKLRLYWCSKLFSLLSSCFCVFLHPVIGHSVVVCQLKKMSV